MNDLTRKLRAAADWCDQNPSKNVYSVLLCGEDDVLQLQVAAEDLEGLETTCSDFNDDRWKVTHDIAPGVSVMALIRIPQLVEG